MIAALLRAEIPTRPDTNVISDGMWGLMAKCWDYVPMRRPTCENIRESLQAQNIRAEPSPHSENTTDFWKEVRAQSNIRVTRAENIILEAVSVQTELLPVCALIEISV